MPATFWGMTFGAVPQSTWNEFTSKAVTFAGNTVTMPQASLRPLTADKAIFTTTGALPTSIQPGVEYFVRNPTGTTYQLSSTADGPLIAFATGGTGSHLGGFRNVEPVPLDCDIVRTLDSCAGSWNIHNPSSGVFDWAMLDLFILYHYGRGRRALFTIFSGPQWAMSNGALDAYGKAGGGQVPTDTAFMTNYAVAALQRYNAASPVNPNGERMIWAIEIQNEPQGAAPGTANVNWAGTWAQLAAQMRAVAIGAKAQDPQILVLAPGFTSGGVQAAYGTSQASQFMLASDGAGGRGADWQDGLGYHAYATTMGSVANGLAMYAAEIAHVRRQLSIAGVIGAAADLYMTERQLATTQPLDLMFRLMTIEAAMGIKCSVHHQYETQGLANLKYSPERTMKWNAHRAALRLKTMTDCTLMTDGTVRAVVNGVTTTW